ncbi:PQQ-binding-like beta-propeller repeat protein [bacterium]|nr:PQQ-binding-like beta-propeller repeat protein [bacterium]
MISFKISRFIWVIAIIALMTSAAFAEDWPRFRGPQGNGISMEKNWNAEALNGTPDVEWETHVGMGHGTITIIGNRLFTNGNKHVIAGQDTVNEDILYCFDSITGEELWQYAYPCADRAWPGPRATPTIDENIVYNLSWEGDLFALNLEDGRVIWKLNIVEQGLSAVNNWGFCGSPAIVGEKLLLNLGKAGVALNKKTGEVIWKSEAEMCGLTSPVLFDWQGTKMAFFSSEKFLHAVEVASGKLQWSYEWKTCNDPQVFGDKVFLSANHNRKQTRVIKITGAEPELIWEKRFMMNWAFQNAVLIDGYAYGFGSIRRDQPLHCIELETGELKWQENLGDYGALISADNKLIILDGDGDLLIAKASSEKFETISKAKVLTMASHDNLPEDRRNYCWTEPVLNNGRVYVRGNYGTIACINVSN